LKLAALAALVAFLGEAATELGFDTFLVLALLDLADFEMALVVFGADFDYFL